MWTSSAAKCRVVVSLATKRILSKVPAANRLNAVSSPTAPPEQAAFTSKAAFGPKPRLRAMAGAVGHNRYSGVKVAQIRQSGCWADWVASACLAAATPRLWVVSPGATTPRDWIPQRD